MIAYHLSASTPLDSQACLLSTQHLIPVVEPDGVALPLFSLQSFHVLMITYYTWFLKLINISVYLRGIKGASRFSFTCLY